MRVNLTDVEDRTFEALPAGKYVVKITDFTMKETATKPENKLPGGTPMINWEFTVISDVAGDDKYKNRKLWTNTIIHEKTLFNLKGLLRACGWTDEQLAGEIDFEPDELVGSELVLKVAIRTYNGTPTNDVKQTLPISSASEGAEKASLLP